MKKRYLAITLAILVAAGCVLQPVTVSATTPDEEAQALAPIEELTAGGFYVKENSYIDTENNAFFVTETKQDAVQVIDTYDLDEGVCAISEEIEDCVIVQTDLTDGQAQELEADARVTQVESNYMVYGCSEETGGTAGEELTQWYLDAMNVDPDVQGVSGKKVKVALLDSGVSYISALENVNCVDLTAGEEGDEAGFSDALFHDNSGHGTAMAGLIAADAPDGSLTGINPDADLYSVKILDENLQAPVSKAVEGIYWGIENHVDIINMSFGTEVNSEALHSAVKAAADAGILLVAAAGNNAGKGILYPAAYPEVIAVGATTSDGTVLSGAASGNELELFAPGSQIISTGMVDGYTTGSGTSLATAEVTGITSLLLAQPGATADMVRGLLRATAKEIAGSNAGLVDYGYAQEHFAEYLAAYQNGEVEEAVFENPAVPETYDTEGIVNGLWLTNAHVWLIDKTDTDFQAENITLNSTYVTIMSYAARMADENETYHPPKSANDKRYGGLHGLGAYPLNLYAVWKFANYTNKGLDAKAATKAALASLNCDTDEVLQNVENEGNDPEKIKVFNTENLLGACAELVEGDKDVTNKGYNSTNAKKKYLVAGFACHMIGDIYAHRTLVPAYAIKNAEDPKNTKGFIESNNSSDFKSSLDMKDFENWTGLKNSYNGGRLAFVNLKNYANPSISNFNHRYEDNVKFCRERLNAALKCTKAFLGSISAKKTSNTPTAEIIKQQENVSLIHYDDYMGYYRAATS